MSVLTNKGFDQATVVAAIALKSTIAKKRMLGLASIKKALLGANLESLTHDQALDFGLLLQRGLLAGEKEADAVTKAIGEKMESMFETARATAVSTWGLSATPILDKKDKRVSNGKKNTAGLFLVERDKALAIQVAKRFASGISGETKGKVSKVEFDPYKFFEMPWDEKAEKRYWLLVCSAWLGRARNASIAATFEDSGLEWCRVAAEIDERTTHTCRFLHMKRVLVSSISATYANLVAPGSTSTWVAELPGRPAGGDTPEEDKPVLLLPPEEQGGKARILAQRKEAHITGDGKFDMGSYEQYISDEELAQTLGPPPYHFLCRSLLVPDDYKDPLGLLAEVTQNPVPSELKNLL